MSPEQIAARALAWSVIGLLGALGVDAAVSNFTTTALDRRQRRLDELQHQLRQAGVKPEPLQQAA